jgi:Putative restriction endonuclease
MTVMTATPRLPAILPPFPVRRSTVDEYHRMIETGVLREDDDVELLEGWIVPKMPRSPTHDAVIAMITTEVLPRRLPEGWSCRGQSAMTTPSSEPEADGAVVRGRARDHLSHHSGKDYKPGELVPFVLDGQDFGPIPAEELLP